MSDLNTLLADGNSSAARRARVKLQPRDKGGQWIPTGAALFADIDGFDGGVRGKAVGGTATQKGQKNKVRMLVGPGYEKQGIPANTVLEVEPKNAKLETGVKLSRNYLKSKGIDPDLKNDIPKDIASLPQRLEDMNPQRGDDLDIELANSGLTDEEDKDFRAERDAEPLAKLSPDLAEKVVEGEDVGTLVEDSANLEDDVDPDIADLMAEAFYAGISSEESDNAPDVDAIVDAKAANTPEEVAISDLKPGDIISLGKQGNKRVVEVKPVGDQGEVELFVDDNGRTARVGRLPGNAGIQRVRKAEDAPAPKKPVTEKPKKPAAPRKPVVEPIPEPELSPEKPDPVDSRRIDDGDIIPEQLFSEEESAALRAAKLENLINFDGEAVIDFDANGQPYTPKDPNAMLNYLANAYPDSKFDENGHLVLVRERSKENGKDTQWSIRAAVTGDKKIAYMINLKDLDTGEESDLLYKDQRDSIKSLFGKTNSPQRLADILTGRYQPKYNKQVDLANLKDPWERSRYFAVQGRTKTLTESTKYYSKGYALRVNNSQGPAQGTALEKEVAPLMEAWNSGDFSTAALRLESLFGRVPTDAASHEIVRQAARQVLTDANPEAPLDEKQRFSALVTNASNKYMKGLGRDPRASANPWSSANKINVVEVGQIVEFKNNVGELSTVRITGKNLVETATPAQSADGSFDYGDYVSIIDANGTRSTIPSNALRILKDQNTPLTELKGRVSGRRLREERGITYSPNTLRFPGQQDVPDRVAPVDDSVPGDNFYGKDGANLGVVIESVPITGKDGKKGYGIMYIDKDGGINTVAVAAGEERGPKIITSNTTEPTGGTKKAAPNAAESDPDFDLDSIPFETDPSTVERPKTVGLDFNVPQGAKRNAEQQLALNDEVQAEIDENLGEIAQSLGSGWTFDSSSFNAKSYFNAGELSKLVEEARLQYPNLTDGEIRTLIELKHSKQRGFFGKTKKQMLSDIQKEAAIFRSDKGGIQDLRFDVAPNSETGAIEISIPKEQVTKYVNAVNGINTFIDKNPKFLDLVNGEGGNQYVRVVADSKQFASLYGSVSNSFAGDVSGVLGVNISFRDADGKLLTSILINDGSLSSGSKPAGDFGDASEHTFIHEFGHTIGNLITYDKNKSRRIGNDYDDAFSEFITSYGKTSRDEHFADSFAKYVMTGEASDAFLAFLQSSDLVDSV
jgi:hypothetical protein